MRTFFLIFDSFILDPNSHLENMQFYYDRICDGGKEINLEEPIPDGGFINKRVINGSPQLSPEQQSKTNCMYFFCSPTAASSGVFIIYSNPMQSKKNWKKEKQKWDVSKKIKRGVVVYSKMPQPRCVPKKMFRAAILFSAAILLLHFPAMRVPPSLYLKATWEGGKQRARRKKQKKKVKLDICQNPKKREAKDMVFLSVFSWLARSVFVVG